MTILPKRRIRMKLDDPVVNACTAVVVLMIIIAVVVGPVQIVGEVLAPRPVDPSTAAPRITAQVGDLVPPPRAKAPRPADEPSTDRRIAAKVRDLVPPPLRVNANSSHAAADRVAGAQSALVRDSATAGSTGEEKFYAVCATADRLVFGTDTSPARLVAYHVSNNSRIEGVTLAAGLNSGNGCIISHDGATLIMSMFTTPAKFVKHNVLGLGQAASPLTLNTDENLGSLGARDSTFAFFALFISPAKCAKLRWSDNTRVAVIDMAIGEDAGHGLDFDTVTTDLIMGTWSTPAYAVKISTSPTFARTSSLQLNAGESYAAFVTIADGFSFVLCRVSPGIVVKVKISDMTRVGAVTLSVSDVRGSVADWQFLYAVTLTDPANIVQVRLSDLFEVSVLQLQEGMGVAGALPGGNRSAGVAFFSMYKAAQLGLSVKVQLDTSGAVVPNMLRVSVASADAGEEKFHAVCAMNDRVVYGTYTSPARLVAYQVSDNSRIGGVTLAAGLDEANGCVISHDGAALIASMWTDPAQFVKHDVVGLAQAATPLTLNVGENSGVLGAQDSTSTFVYFALKPAPAKCAKLRWSDNTRVAVIDMSGSENLGRGFDIDTATSDLIMSTYTSPAYAIKISTTPTFARTSSLLLNAGENYGLFVTIADGFSFISCSVSAGIVVKVRNSDMTRVGALTLSVNAPFGSVADWKYLYVVTGTDPASVVQVRLSDLSEVSSLTLHEGQGKMGAMPGADRSAGVAFFSMYKAAQLGLSVKVQLDTTGAVVPNMLRVSVASAAAGEEMLHGVCATADRVVYSTWTTPGRLVAYHVADNSRIEGVTLAAGLNESVDCVISADGATLIASIWTTPATFVQHNVVGLAQAASPLTLNVGEDTGMFGARDSTFCFFALKTTPVAKCAKIQWSDNSRVAVIDMSAGEDLGRGLAVETATSDLIMSTGTSPAYAVKISTTPAFARSSSLQLNSGEDDGRFLTIADGFSFVSCYVSPGIVVKVKNADMTRVGAVTLSVNSPYGSIADWTFLYVVTDTNPANVVQVRLSDLSKVSVLQLQEGSGKMGSLPGGNRSAGVAFFSMWKSGQLGLSVKVQLDASGAVCDSNCPPAAPLQQSTAVEDSALPIAVVAGGAGGGIALIIIIVLLLMHFGIIKKCWRTEEDETGTGQKASDAGDVPVEILDDLGHAHLSTDGPHSPHSPHSPALGPMLSAAMIAPALAVTEPSLEMQQQLQHLTSPRAESYTEADDLDSVYDAALACSSLLNGGQLPSAAAGSIDTIAAQSESEATGKMLRGWSETLQKIGPNEAEAMRGSDGVLRCESAIGIFELLEKAPGPIGLLGGTLCGIFTMAWRVAVNESESLILANRCARLMPVLIQACKSNIATARGVFAEFKAAVDDAMELVKQFVPPDDDSEAWLGERIFNWLKYKMKLLSASPEWFNDAHQRIDRVLLEASVAIGLDAKQQSTLPPRALDEIKQSCEDSTARLAQQLREQMTIAINSATAETRATIIVAQGELSSLFARVEKKVDNIFRLLMREHEFSDLDIDPKRVTVRNESLGQGGNCRVYACALDLATELAAKTPFTVDKEEARGVLREAALMKDLRSPGIVSCYGVVTTTIEDAPEGEDRPRFFLLMERCLCSLEDLKFPLSFSVAFHLMSTVCSGVLALHRRGRVHRDIKPQNILLSKSFPPEAKLHDFGSAKKIDAAKDMFATMRTQTATQNVGLIGTTLGFAAPELFKSSAAQATTASDVYALGVSLYVLLEGENNTLGLDADDLPEQWPSEVRDLVGACIERRPQNRIGLEEIVRRVAQLRQKFRMSNDDGAALFGEARAASERIEAEQLQHQQQRNASGGSGSGEGDDTVPFHHRTNPAAVPSLRTQSISVSSPMLVKASNADDLQ